MNLAEEIFLRANPASMAILGEDSLSYAELDHRSGEVAAWLRAAGTRPADRIGLRCRDGAGHVILALGILRAGCCLVPLAPELTVAEHQEIISTLALRVVISGNKDADATHQAEAGGMIFSFSTTGLNDPILDGHMEGTSPAFIRFSSGTTGTAKGILLTHGTLRDRIMAANAGLGIGHGDRILWTLSMSHHFAVSIILYLWNGAAIILPGSHLPGDLLAAARTHQATVLYGAPCHYLLLTSGEEELGSKNAWPSLRLAVSTTSPLDATTADKFAKLFGTYPVQALGLMEVGLPLINRRNPELRPSSVGTVQPGFESEIRSHDRVCATGEQGQLFLRGPGMFDAYVSPWRTRAEVTGDGGWFPTGDIATADAEGYITLVGRQKSVISVGGLKFFPEEVEEVLRNLPGVREARVIGTDHPALGALPVAEVIPEEGAVIVPTELMKSCRGRLSRFKIPVEIRIVDSLPRTPSGKIRRT